MLYVSDWRACSAQWINNGLPGVTAAASQFLQQLPPQTIRAQVARGWGNVDTRVLVCSGPLLHTINYWLRYWVKFDLKRLSEINVVWEYCKVWNQRFSPTFLDFPRIWLYISLLLNWVSWVVDATKVYMPLWWTDICFSDALSSTTWSHLDKNYGEREGETAGLSALPSQMPGLDWTVIFNPYSFSSNCPLLSAGEGENRAVFSLRWKYCSWMERGYSHWQIVSIFGLSPGRKRQRENIFKQDHFQEHAPYI